jgi:molybdopterin synthase catalytic subunit
MHVRVLFFGRLRELAGCGEDWAEVRDGARLEDLFAHYAARNPELAQLRASLAASVNEEYAAWDAVLKANDEVAFLPPVSGGEAPRVVTESAADICEIVHEPIRAAELIAAVKSPGDGAVCIFDGIVRNNSKGRETKYLEYEAYQPMALRVMRDILAETRCRFPVDRIALAHRLGRLEIGATSVLIAVSAPHRAAAFDACRFVIESLKRSAPIWKREYSADGAVWVEGSPARPIGAATGSQPTPVAKDESKSS